MSFRVLIMLLFISKSAISQVYSYALTKEEVVNFFKWEMSQRPHKLSSEFQSTETRILSRTQQWGTLIPFPKDSIESFDFFSATFKGIKAADTLSANELNHLRQQFKAKESMQLDNFIGRNNFVHEFVKGDVTTIIYTIPLIVSNGDLLFLQKDFTANEAYMINRILCVYKKDKKGNWFFIAEFRLS